MKKRGVFITLEGIDGVGKSTQALLLEKYLGQVGWDPLLLREPGGTRIGEAIREIILKPDYGELAPPAELLLYEAARAQLVTEKIRPALEKGRAVVCERYTDSTLAYQGFGLGQEKEAILRLNELATGGLKPDLTILLDLEPEEALHRSGREDRIENRDLAYYRRVREGFLWLAEEEPERIKVVKVAGRRIEEVWREIRHQVNEVIRERPVSGKV